MSTFVVSATVDDPWIKKDAIFNYRITDNRNYTIDKFGRIEAKAGYVPKIGDKITVEISYRCEREYLTKAYKTFTVKI